MTEFELVTFYLLFLEDKVIGVGMTGFEFEPVTFCTEDKCATKLCFSTNDESKAEKMDK